jgi:DNA-cytosine methyltransferase
MNNRKEQKGLNVVSLFDGISCGRLALKNVGIDVEQYTAAEIDNPAIQVSKNNFPDIIRVGSVVGLSIPQLPKTDLLIGGSPCQSFSRGGDQSGFDGKSKLFWEYIRIKKELNPRFFLLENVVMRKEWEQIITDALGVDPVMIDSKYFSAQKRQRLYWTNIPFDNINPDSMPDIQLSDIVTGDHIEVTDTPLNLGKSETGLIIRNATKKGFLIAENGDSVNLEIPKSLTRRGRVGKGKTNTLNRSCNYAFVKDQKLFQLNINELESLQNLPKNYTAGVSPNQRKSMIGNGWTVGVISHIFKSLKYITKS